MKSVRKESNCQSLMTMKISIANLGLRLVSKFTVIENVILCIFTPFFRTMHINTYVILHNTQKKESHKNMTARNSETST
jgi:hypothetical protein